MATIKISDLRPTGAELFQDSESFLNELAEQELGDIKGGIVILFKTTVVLSGHRCSFEVAQ